MRRSNARTASSSSSLEPKMDSLNLQFQSKPHNTTTSRSNFSRFSPKHTKRNLLISIIVLISLIVFIISRVSRKSHPHYGLLIDGGSTGTRIHVFKVSVRKGGEPVFDFGKEGLASMRVNPGLSSFASDPEGAGESLLELLEFAKDKVPTSYWGETEIRLMTTAGLRLLQVDVQEQILESCRSVLASSGFKFRNDWASVITGADEGIYAWVAANYAHGTLGGDPKSTIGIIELGGASAQVTFVSDETLPPEFSHTLEVGKFTYSLYSHSLLHLGQNVAYESLREVLISRDQKFSASSARDEIYIDPCTPKGYSHRLGSWNFSPGTLNERTEHFPTVHAGGNFSECRSAALTLLQQGKGECSYKHCNIGKTFIPVLQGKLLATENFFYTWKFFGLSSKSFLSDLMLAGQQFCGEDWSSLQRKYHSHAEEDLLHYCFSSAYIVALLHDSLGIALDDGRIVVANQVENIPLDWALGVFILQNMNALDTKDSHWITAIVSDDSTTRLTLFIFAVLIILAWLVMKWQKPQLKTIYDLEKGRYIVTRVNR